jgi:hypothetical protein
MKKCGIIGFATTKDLAPLAEAGVDWFLLNELYNWSAPKFAAAGTDWARWFELHDMQTITDSNEDQAHLKWLRAQPAGRPIYMQETHADMPASVRYPIEAMCARFGRYFTSSIGYMLALAIAEGRDDKLVVVDPEAAYGWIGVYGIDLASDSEYGDQRPNAEYFVGLARGLGIEVFIAEGAALLKADRLYGYEPGLGDGPVGEAYDRKRLTDLAKQRLDAQAAVHTIEGAMQEAENRVALRRHLKRGVAVPGYSSMCTPQPMIPIGRTADGRPSTKAST